MPLICNFIFFSFQFNFKFTISQFQNSKCSISFFFSFQFNFKFTISQFQNSKCYKFQNSNIPISNFKFLNLKSQIYKILSFQFQNLILKFLSFKFITEFLISNISNYKFQNFNFKSVFKNSKHVINSIVPIKWDLVELICVT